MTNVPNISHSGRKRVVIVGGGFGGLKLARRLSSKLFDVVLIDKNNFHLFQPLLYQVATAGLEPSSISFPLRKIFQRQKHIHFRVAELYGVIPEENKIETSIGRIGYDYLVLAYGTTNNFFGNSEIAENAVPMKSVADSIYIRNLILQNYEEATNVDRELQEEYLNIVIAGAGPTGVELAGAMAEMKKFVLPKDYPELDLERMRVILVEGSDRVLGTMSEKASGDALRYLQDLGVEVRLSTMVKGFDGHRVELADGKQIVSKTLLWAAGVKTWLAPGIPDDAVSPRGRILVDRYNRFLNEPNIFAVGDIAEMQSDEFPEGHPQVAQPSIQQGQLLADNLNRLEKGKMLKEFVYKDPGSLATIGRNLAVADLPYGRFSGFFAWLLWLFVHIMYLVGTKNKLFVFINWAWSYVTYDQSFRLLIRPRLPRKPLLAREKSKDPLQVEDK